MKWKKRKNPLAEASEALTEDLAYAADKKAIDEHVKDALRDKQTVDRNMEDNIKKDQKWCSKWQNFRSSRTKIS